MGVSALRQQVRNARHSTPNRLTFQFAQAICSHLLTIASQLKPNEINSLACAYLIFGVFERWGYDFLLLRTVRNIQAPGINSM